MLAIISSASSGRPLGRPAWWASELWLRGASGGHVGPHGGRALLVPCLGFSGPLLGSPGTSLCRSREPLEPLWVALGLSWAAPDLSWAVLGASWASPGPPLGALGPLLAAKCDVLRNLVKTVGFHCSCRFLGAPGALPGPAEASWRPLGPSEALFAALGRLLGRP